MAEQHPFILWNTLKSRSSYSADILLLTWQLSPSKLKLEEQVERQSVKLKVPSSCCMVQVQRSGVNIKIKSGIVLCGSSHLVFHPHLTGSCAVILLRIKVLDTLALIFILWTEIQFLSCNGGSGSYAQWVAVSMDLNVKKTDELNVPLCAEEILHSEATNFSLNYVKVNYVKSWSFKELSLLTPWILNIMEMHVF